MPRLVLAALALSCLVLRHPGAQESPLTWNSEQGGAPTGATLENFDSLELGTRDGQATPRGIVVRLSGNAAIVRGARGGHNAMPYLTGENGRGFGPDGTDQPDGPDETTYITTGPSGAHNGPSEVTLLLPLPARYFGLLWGSVDRNNLLVFFYDDERVGQITGAEIVDRPAGLHGPEGTRYVNVNAETPFNRVVLAAGGILPFEFDNVALSRTVISMLAPAAVGR